MIQRGGGIRALAALRIRPCSPPTSSAVANPSPTEAQARTITVAIIEDNRLVREGMTDMLNELPDVKVRLEAELKQLKVDFSVTEPISCKLVVEGPGEDAANRRG